MTMSASHAAEHFRADGLRITHDPYGHGMAEKYGVPGATDSEGFDPYADSVGPGIYGGVVKRDAHTGRAIVGKQYQDHNAKPGPVYAGGGYTPLTSLLGNPLKAAELLNKFPDLVNDLSTGGAQPLHMCGMNEASQSSVALLISRGADIEALDTYGMTPLHRMASNNLVIGAKMLLDAGADPKHLGDVNITPLQVAQSAAAHDVIELLRGYGNLRRTVKISKIVVGGAGEASVNGEYLATDAVILPRGFVAVCQEQGWDSIGMWAKLNGGAPWYHASNGAYIYWNRADQHWWIDEPSGAGVFKAKGPSHAPPQHGWVELGQKGPPPSLVATVRATKRSS